MKLSLQGLTYYILFFILVMGFTFALTTNASGENEINYISITLSEGDSLWKVNEAFKEYHQLEFFEFVSWIENKNKVRSESLKPGDQLILPIKKEHYSKNLTAIASGE
ncbi:cell division suppressor protein YneA [Litchfieldia salsa]|uniref:Cell division suppressor protein YneA n=1 Tax=Litchfieldia salsa TaxID=930152 RepID=A0A1H0X156_9BACI|nr:hypothetical protein [Litchfieldia salsa]SDP96683.1 hypothetical protein SAMN05216565_12228 [Litchfieldia salsa]